VIAGTGVGDKLITAEPVDPKQEGFVTTAVAEVAQICPTCKL